MEKIIQNVFNKDIIEGQSPTIINCFKGTRTEESKTEHAANKLSKSICKIIYDDKKYCGGTEESKTKTTKKTKKC